LHIDQKFPGGEFTGFKYNKTSNTPEKVAMLDKLTEYLDNHEEVVLSLKEYLIPDYNLFNNVQFYNNR
jgi:predicted RND superfamily exporter protein